MKTYSLSNTGIDDYLWDVRQYIVDRTTIAKAESDISPLVYYINTGRACSEFIRLLLSVRPFIIARVLMKGGSVNAAIAAVKKRIGFVASDM